MTHHRRILKLTQARPAPLPGGLFSEAMKLPGILLILTATACTAGEPEPEIIPPDQYQPRLPSIEATRDRLLAENPQRFEARTFSHRGRTVRYRLFTPEKSSAPLPLVIVLHGSSGKGTDNKTQILAGTGALGAGIWATPERQKDNPCYVLAPQCPPGEMWTHTASWTSPTHPFNPEPTPSLAGVIALLDDLLKTQPIDPARLYLVGASMGGYGTFEWLVHEPGRFAAAIPICGGMPEGQAAKLKNTPLWIFRGENDNIVPVAESRRAFAGITAAGGKPRYTEFAKGGHQISVHAWTDPAVARWLFSQRR